MQGINFKVYEPKESDIVNTWPLSEVKQQLGLASIDLEPSKDKTGFRVIFRKPDGSSTCLPASKQMTAELFSTSRLAQMKDGGYIIVRPEGASSVKLASI